MLKVCVISSFHCEVDENCAVWDITQCIVVIPYPCFWTTYWSRLQASVNPRRKFLDTWRWYLQVVPKHW